MICMSDHLQHFFLHLSFLQCFTEINTKAFLNTLMGNVGKDNATSPRVSPENVTSCFYSHFCTIPSSAACKICM